MGRYIGPKSKIARKFGEAIFGTDKSLEKKNYPPGQHGLMRKRKKVSEYGTQLLEKQKAKAIYGSTGEAVPPHLRGGCPSWVASPARTCSVFWSAAWTTWYTAWASPRRVPLPASWFLTATSP